MNKRIEWVDMAKGFTIILVILGHTLESGLIEKILRGAIYSFHMPLFFILSCYTYKLSDSADEFLTRTEKSFKHIVIPAIVIYLFQYLINWKNYRYTNSIDRIADMINTIVYSSGTEINRYNICISPVYGVWFLFTLFYGRSLFDYLYLRLSQRKFIVTIIVCSILGVVLGNIQWLPLSLDICLAIMPFFYFGNYLKRIDINKNRVRYMILSIIVWAVTLTITYFVKDAHIDLNCRRYTLFPVFYITAISGTMLIIYLCSIINKFGIMKFIIYLGKNSFCLYAVHMLDDNYDFLWKIQNNNFINFCVRVTIDILITVLLLQCNKLIQRKTKNV